MLKFKNKRVISSFFFLIMIKRLKKEFQKRVISYIAAAFGFVAGLAWNEAIKALIEYLFPLHSNSVIAKFIYAALITFALIIVTNYILKLDEDNSG